MKSVKNNKTFIQCFITIFTVAFLSIIALFSNISLVFAASINIGVTGLSAESSGNGSWSISNGTVTGSVNTKVTSGCTSDTYDAQSGTLTLKNTLSETASLSFTVSNMSLDNGSATINGLAANTTSYTFALEPNASIDIVITSRGDADGTTTISLMSFALETAQNVNVTFEAPTNGAYTVDGSSISEATTITKTSVDAFALAATPAANYKFMGWYNSTQSKYVSFSATDSLYFNEDATISPVFISTSIPVWQVASNLFTDLSNAISNAQSTNTPTIALISNGTLESGNYTIPNGKTLLMPFDSLKTVVRDEPEVVYGSHTTPSAYSLLTMASGASITVANGGAICCASKLCSTGQLGGWNGCPTGPGGRIKMNSGSSITIQSGGNLFVWGYIYGSGSITAESGSTVYEAFQIKDWRGGTATSNCYSYTFIFSQYYVQNIEVPLAIYAGATEKLYSSMNASSSAYPVGATLVGSNDALFNITTGYMIKDYIESTDRLQIDIYGSAEITSMRITGLPVIGSISTTDYEMPITSNMTINVHSGTTSINQNAKLLPSVEIKVDSGATLSINSGKKVYVYDNDDWGNYTGSARLYVIGYSVANGTTAKRNASGLVDACIDVNGTLTVKGNLYTSAGGADIISSGGTGKVDFTTAPGSSSATIYEMSGNSTKTAVTFNPPKLHDSTTPNDNASATYTEASSASAGNQFLFCTITPKWYNKDKPLHVNYDANGGSGTMSQYTHNANGHFDYTTLSCTFTPPQGQVFSHWNTKANDSGISVAAGSQIHVDGDITLYAQWTENTETFTVTWKNYDETVLETDTNVLFGTAPSYDGATPTKPGDAQHTFTFIGWNTSKNAESGYSISNLPTVSEDVTYYAIFTSAAQTYTITFKNDDGTTLSVVIVEYGATPSYDGATPTKASTAEFDYTFNGWTPEIVAVTGDATYTATYTQTARKYTVTWKDEDGTVLETDTNVIYGATPSYDGATPTKASTAEFDYTFNGWTPEIVAVTGDATYTATYTQTTRKYTVTWKNGETVLETDTDVPYGQHPDYNGATPTKEQSGRQHYTFLGWALDPDSTVGIEDPSVLTISGDTTYYAIFRKYVIGLYKDDDGVTRLYNENGVLQSSVTGLFYYDSTVYEDDGDDRYYYLDHGILQEGYGLVALEDEDSETYLYYVLEDGTILMNPNGCTFYVSKTNNYSVNGITVENGLYYFDSDGHMWMGNTLITDSTGFRVISSSESDTIEGGNN